MAAAIDSPLRDELYSLLRSSRWTEAMTFYERELTREEKAQPGFRFPYAVALMRAGRTGSAIRMIEDDGPKVATARDDLRRWVIPEQIREGRLQIATQLLDVILKIDPDSVEDLRLRGSLLGRMKRLEDAARDAARVVELAPDDLPGHTQYLQLLLQSDKVEEAGQHAARLGPDAAGHPRLANIALLALTRSGRLDQAVGLALDLSTRPVSDEAVAAAIVRTLFEAGRSEESIDAGERLLAEGWDHPVLRSSLGQAYLATFRDDRYERAIDHLREGLDLEPADFRMNSAMGEALLRNRDYEGAIPYLERACSLRPKAAQARALYARALKQAGRFDDAAKEFRRLLELQPSSPRWQRYAAGALSQAGRRREAVQLFDAFVAERRKTLPRDFEQGLEALWDKVDSVDIPQARLDWAWSLSEARPNDRLEWERRAKWGHLADHYLLDWLECRDDRVSDAMQRLSDLSEAERVLGGIDSSNGMILASAHIGPMYAGPLALELLGLKSRWLASTPSVARTAYASSLISTSDQDDMQVARSFMLSLRKGFSVVIAVDGAINLAAPRIRFEGQEMTYSSFAARTAHRLGVPSVFCAPRWEGSRIGFVIEPMPDALPDEDPDLFADRWRDAFLDSLKRYLSGEPENLRLSGGLWRHIP